MGRVKSSIYDTFLLERKKEEKRMDIKVGDKVVSLFNGLTIKKGNEYTVAEMRVESHYYGDDVRFTLIDAKTGEKVYGIGVDGLKKVEPPKHEGKILIMVDEKDNNKIIARDLLTNKTAEAKCSPKDEWDFNKGAKLALERLIGSEKPKRWTGKVVCITTTHNCQGCGNTSFIVGKVYAVQDGAIRSDNGTVYTGIYPICDVNDLINGRWGYCPIFCKFIEYKGGAEE